VLAVNPDAAAKQLLGIVPVEDLAAMAHRLAGMKTSCHVRFVEFVCNYGLWTLRCTQLLTDPVKTMGCRVLNWNDMEFY